MAFAIDGTAGDQFSSTNTGTISLTTTQANDVVILEFFAQNSTGGIVRNVSTVTSAHVTWTKRKSYNWQANGGTWPCVLEIWWGVAASPLTAELITITLSGNIDDAAYQAFGVSGHPTPSSPWDANASLAGANANSGGSGTVTPLTVSGVNTTATAGMVVGCWGGPSAIASMTLPSGSSAVRATQQNSGGVQFAYEQSFDQVFSSALSSASFTTTPSPAGFWGMIVDVLSGAAAASPPIGLVKAYDVAVSRAATF